MGLEGWRRDERWRLQEEWPTGFDVLVKLDLEQYDFDTWHTRTILSSGSAASKTPGGTRAWQARASSTDAKTSKTALPRASVKGRTFFATVLPETTHETKYLRPVEKLPSGRVSSQHRSGGMSISGTLRQASHTRRQLSDSTLQDAPRRRPPWHAFCTIAAFCCAPPGRREAPRCECEGRGKRGSRGGGRLLLK